MTDQPLEKDEPLVPEPDPQETIDEMREGERDDDSKADPGEPADS